VEQNGFFSKATYFDTQKKKFASNEKSIITREVEKLYRFQEIEI